MARIPEDEIQRIKRETDLLALVRSRGTELKKHGSRDFVGRCPFHDDNESPNFIISPAKGLYHCMACGVAGNAIQFVEKFDGISFRHAFELLANGGKAAFENAPAKRTKQATVPKLPCPLDLDADDGTLLDQVSDYYHERLSKTPPPSNTWLAAGLDDEALLQRFRIGFADRTLGLRLPEKTAKKARPCARVSKASESSARKAATSTLTEVSSCRLPTATTTLPRSTGARSPNA